MITTQQLEQDDHLLFSCSISELHQYAKLALTQSDEQDPEWGWSDRNTWLGAIRTTLIAWEDGLGDAFDHLHPTDPAPDLYEQWDQIQGIKQLIQEAE